MLFPISLLAKNQGLNLETDFNQYNYNTFLQLKPGFSFDGFADKLEQLQLKISPNDGDIEYLWLPLSKIHLHRSDGSDGGYSTVRMFFIIAILILVIACINYVNLSTARSLVRAKEVSLRKIVGAARIQLFFQFIIETTLLFIIATAFALGLVYLLLPVFNNVSGKELVLDFTDYHLLNR